MTPKIICVHGNASPKSVVWPVGALAERFALTHPRHCDGGFQSPCQCKWWERWADDVFAQANGWVVHHGRWPRRFGGVDFRREVLPLIDHATPFRQGRRIIAILSHDYNPQRNFSALPGQLVVHRLPRSWYWRGGIDATTAFLLRPAVAVMG